MLIVLTCPNRPTKYFSIPSVVNSLALPSCWTKYCDFNAYLFSSKSTITWSAHVNFMTNRHWQELCERKLKVKWTNHIATEKQHGQNDIPWKMLLYWQYPTYFLHLHKQWSSKVRTSRFQVCLFSGLGKLCQLQWNNIDDDTRGSNQHLQLDAVWYSMI